MIGITYFNIGICTNLGGGGVSLLASHPIYPLPVGFRNTLDLFLILPVSIFTHLLDPKSISMPYSPIPNYLIGSKLYLDQPVTQTQI